MLVLSAKRYLAFILRSFVLVITAKLVLLIAYEEPCIGFHCQNTIVVALRWPLFQIMHIFFSIIVIQTSIYTLISKTRYGPNIPAADMEGNGYFDF